MGQILMQTQSLLILIMLIIGVSLHKKRKLHIKIMLAAITWDLLLILQIEFSRQAIDKAVKMVTNPLLLNVHVSIAVSTVILYGVMIFLGRKVYLNQISFLPKHRIFGYITLTMRALTFITSFWAPVGG